MNESVHTQQLQDGNCYLNAVMMMNITIVAQSASARQDQMVCSVQLMVSAPGPFQLPCIFTEASVQV